MIKNILYIGCHSGTSLHRAQELTRQGIKLDFIDTILLISNNKTIKYIIDRIIYLFGPSFFEPLVIYRLSKILNDKKYYLIWVDGGELFGLKALNFLSQSGVKILNYNHDDPFGNRDKNRFKLYKKSIPHYDYIVVPRRVNIEEAILLGAKKVILSRWAADTHYHKRCTFNKLDEEKWRSDVIFIGTWMPERGSFFLRLIELGLPLKIYGTGWQKAGDTVLQS